jgi:hypothetical protein
MSGFGCALNVRSSKFVLRRWGYSELCWQLRSTSLNFLPALITMMLMTRVS